MNFLNKIVERFIRANKRLKRWQRVISLLAALVVFATTYALVLPAVTLDKETASAQSGIEIAASENDPESEGTVYGAEPEEEPVEEPAEKPQAEEPQEEQEEPQDTQEADPVTEDSGSESGSLEAEETSAEENDDQDTEAADIQTVDEQTAPRESLDVGEAGFDVTEEYTHIDETLTEGETVEEIKLITEKTQLTYEYIDEYFEDGIEDEKDDGIDDGYFVYAEFGADAKLPEGVELSVKEITKESDPEAYEAYYEKALSGLQDKYDENTMLSFARFYDIKFVHNGEEVEPAGDVKVRIEYKKAFEIQKETTVDAIHFDKNKDEEPEVIKSEVNKSESKAEKNNDDIVKTVEFESAQFSVYGIVGTETLVAQVITESGDTIQVTVEAKDIKDIVRFEGLRVNELSPENDAYWDAYDAVVAAKEKEDEDFNEETFGFFAADIELLDADGESFEPEGTVSVKMELISLPADEDTLISTMEVQHLAEQDGKIDVQTVAKNSAVSKVDDIITAEFSVDSFSTFTLTWTGDGGESEVISDDDAEAVLNIQNNGETYATVNVHYVDVYGHNVRSPLTDAVNGQTPVAIDELLNQEIEGYEYKGAHYGSNSGDEITTIAVDRGAGSPVQNYVAQGTTGNSGRPENWNPTTGTEYWGDINGTKARVYYRYQGNNWRFMNVENGGNNSNRYNNGTVYTLETGTSYEYTLSVSNDDAVVATETQNVTGVWQEAADIYLVYENTDPDKKHATIHFGTLNSDGSFTDLQETASLDTDAASISVNPTISGYAFVGAYYSEEETTIPAVGNPQVDKVLRKVEDAWQYTDVNTKEKGFIKDESHIYVTYKEKSGSGTPTPPSPAGDDIPKPQTVKKVTDNGDGTYDIQLDIIGKQIVKEERKGANVLLIFDRTSSMGDNQMSGAPAPGRRIDAARQAVHTLVEALDPGKNPVEVSVFSFARFADPDEDTPEGYGGAGLDWTEDKDSITDFTDGLTLAASGAGGGLNGGTNWEAALDYANTALATADEDPTYIIFLTDGNPTIHEGTAPNSGGINTTPNADSAEYLRAETAAGNLDTKYKFYGILCADQSDGPLLQTLVDYLNNNGHDATHILADDSETLNRSFQGIAEYIIEQLNASNVSTNDGVTSLSTVNASVSGAAGAFKYYKAYEVKYADGKYTYVDDDGTVKEITRDQVKEYNYQEDGGEGNVVNKSYFYYNREVWEGAPGASYNTETGVTWDLSSENNLQEGGIYTIRFTIWPSQAAYDLLADLNNGIKVYEAGHENSITDSERDQVYESGGVYYMKTNTNLDTTYTFSGETYTDEIPYHQGAMDLEARQIFLQKLWPENLLDDYGEGHSLDGIKDEVTLTVTKDKKDYLDVTLKKENNWKENVFISCGLLTVHDGKVEIKEPGHDYTVTEPGIFSYYWDLIADVYRPMVIGYEDDATGTVKHEANLLILDESIKEADNVESFKIEGKIYKKQAPGNVTLNARNYRRSNLNLKKIVTGANAPKDALFEYTVKIKDAGQKEVWFSAMEDTDSDTYQLLETSSNVTPETKTVEGAVYNPDDNTYTYTDTEGGKEHTRYAADDGTGGLMYTGFYYVASNAEFTIKIKDGWNVRFINLLHGSTFSFTEGDMDEGFSFVGIDTDTLYDFTLVEAGTEWCKVDEEDGRTITGTIVEPNNSFMVDYTNKWETVDFLLEKVKEDRETKISGSTFDLETKEEPGSWVKVQTDIKPGGTATVIDEETGAETVVNIENPVDIGGLGIGRYRFKEKKAPDGYILTTEYTYFEVYKDGSVLKVRLTDEDGNPLTDEGGDEVTETDTAKLSSDTIGSTTVYKISITNTPGPTLPNTGGPGTRLFMILGTILIAGAGMLLWRRRTV